MKWKKMIAERIQKKKIMNWKQRLMVNKANSKAKWKWTKPHLHFCSFFFYSRIQWLQIVLVGVDGKLNMKRAKRKNQSIMWLQFNHIIDMQITFKVTIHVFFSIWFVMFCKKITKYFFAVLLLSLVIWSQKWFDWNFIDIAVRIGSEYLLGHGLGHFLTFSSARCRRWFASPKILYII